jgi:hypothetical protein
VRSAVQLGIPKQVLAAAFGDQEQQCGMHRSLRFLRHRGWKAPVTASCGLIGYMHTVPTCA